jgi:hypothetical protein
MTAYDGMSGPVRDILAGGSYDFYTNYLVMRLNGAIYAGQVRPTHLDLEVTQRKDRSQSRPLEWRYRYERRNRDKYLDEKN